MHKANLDTVIFAHKKVSVSSLLVEFGQKKNPHQMMSSLAMETIPNLIPF